MSEPRATFMDLYRRGEARAEDIDDHVSRWHDGGGPEGMSLHEYLGMSWGEYGAWMRDPRTLLRPAPERREERPVK